MLTITAAQIPTAVEVGSGRVRAATLVDLPAFREAYLELDGEPTADGFQPVKGVLALEQTNTGDGRLFRARSLRWEGDTWPLRWAERDLGEHDGAVTVGFLNRIERDDEGRILGWGMLDLNIEDAVRVRNRMARGTAGGVSVDLDDIPDAQVFVHEPLSFRDARRLVAAGIFPTGVVQ